MAQNTRTENVLREFNPVGKFRIRLVEGRKGPALDIREYVDTDTFQGFTRRGIRLDADGLRYLKPVIEDSLKEIEKIEEKGGETK